MDKVVFVFIAIVSLAFGIFTYKKPLRIFELQKRFYASINWRIEPISVQKEIRNTKIMGFLLIVFVILSTIYWIFT